MSKEELNEAYAEGRITRRAFAKGIAALGGALGAGVLFDAPAGAQGKKAAAKKSPPVKKVPAKKAAPKKPTVPVPPELG